MQQNLINCHDDLEKWHGFRQSLLSLFDARSDTVIDLIDSLISNQNIHNVYNYQKVIYFLVIITPYIKE